MNTVGVNPALRSLLWGSVGTVAAMFLTNKYREPCGFVSPRLGENDTLACWFLLCDWRGLWSSRQIVCALEEDDSARKQRLAFKLEQVVAFMSLESWGPRFPELTGTAVRKPEGKKKKPSRAWAPVHLLFSRKLPSYLPSKQESASYSSSAS